MSELRRSRERAGYTSTGTKTTTQPVIDDVVHAVLAARPRPRYAPAQLSWWLWFALDDILPTQMSDAFHAYWMRNEPKVHAHK